MKSFNADTARAELRALHAAYLARNGRRFCVTPFRARAVPGWVYLPHSDTAKTEPDFIASQIAELAPPF